jgi:hypothetical protein
MLSHFCILKCQNLIFVYLLKCQISVIMDVLAIFLLVNFTGAEVPLLAVEYIMSSLRGRSVVLIDGFA